MSSLMSYLPKVLSYRSTVVIKIAGHNIATVRWFGSSTLHFNTKSATTHSNVVATKRDSEIEGHHRKQQQVHESPNAYRNLVFRATNTLHSPSYRNYLCYSTDAAVTTPQITTKSTKRKMVSTFFDGEWEKFISMVVYLSIFFVRDAFVLF